MDSGECLLLFKPHWKTPPQASACGRVSGSNTLENLTSIPSCPRGKDMSYKNVFKFDQLQKSGWRVMCFLLSIKGFTIFPQIQNT